MPTLKSLQPKLGDQVLVYLDGGTITYSERGSVYAIAATIIAVDSRDYWLGWKELPPKAVGQSPSLYDNFIPKEYAENWEKFVYSVLLSGDSPVHSIVGKSATPSVKPDQPCRQCGRNCSPGDKACWWCTAPNPC